MYTFLYSLYSVIFVPIYFRSVVKFIQCMGYTARRYCGDRAGNVTLVLANRVAKATAIASGLTCTGESTFHIHAFVSLTSPYMLAQHGNGKKYTSIFYDRIDLFCHCNNNHFVSFRFTCSLKLLCLLRVLSLNLPFQFTACTASTLHQNSLFIISAA